MERTNIPAPEGAMKWRKKGGGSLRLTNRIIKPGQVFMALPEEIPVAFRDLVEPLGGGDFVSKPQAPKEAPKKTVYTIQPRGKSKSQFDIVDEQGKKVNEKALKKADAEELKKTLEA